MSSEQQDRKSSTKAEAPEPSHEDKERKRRPTTEDVFADDPPSICRGTD